ncbi:MAG: NUDIX domain-containing protein [Bacteroidetes bacterium]|nr:NUDIX domain-containing protein [Bacteroidota bacterium]
MNGGKDQECRAEIASIVPLDALEQQHIEDALAWVDSGAPLFRTAKAATPPKHLVAYFAVVDDDHILLVDHKNAQLWLPTGGHVEPNEHPRTTVERELLEELGLRCTTPVAAPIMITCTETVGTTAGHTDVSLWYVVAGDRRADIAFDASEFHTVQWFPFSEVPLHRSDPHMARFLQKLVGSG